MKYLHKIAIIILINSCMAFTPQNQNSMEKFNINEFNAKKNNGEYTTILDDGTIINQLEYSGGFVEKVIPKEGWFYTYKEFFSNGNLKRKGELFKKGDYKSGKWVQCDEKGNIVDEQNYDKQYNLTLKEVFKILNEKEIIFSLSDNYNSIIRNVINGKPTWVVRWMIQEDRLERIFIDDSSGKISKQDFVKFEESN